MKLFNIKKSLQKYFWKYEIRNILSRIINQHFCSFCVRLWDGFLSSLCPPSIPQMLVCTKKVSNSPNFWALDLQQHLRPTAHFENWIRMCRNVPSARRFLFHSIFLISIQCFEVIEVCQVRSFVALVLILAIDKLETNFCEMEKSCIEFANCRLYLLQNTLK